MKHVEQVTNDESAATLKRLYEILVTFLHAHRWRGAQATAIPCHCGLGSASCGRGAVPRHFPGLN